MSAGIWYIVLNVLRFLTVLAEILVCVGTMLVINYAAKDGFGTNFFAIVCGIARIGSAIALIMTELPIPITTRFIKVRAPVLVEGFSLAWSGVPMLTIASSMFSDLHNSYFKTETTGRITQEIVKAGGISIGVFGIIYCLMPFIFWKAPSGECRRLRDEGASRPNADDLEYMQKTEAIPEMKISRPILGTAIGGSLPSLGSSFVSNFTPWYGHNREPAIRSTEKI